MTWWNFPLLMVGQDFPDCRIQKKKILIIGLNFPFVMVGLDFMIARLNFCFLMVGLNFLIAGLQLKIPNNKVKISFPNDKVGFS